MHPEPRQADHPLTSKEGWAAFTQQVIAPPALLPPAAQQKLTPAERGDYDRAREDYHAQLVIVSTPTIRHVAAAGRKRILLNRPSTRPAAACSSPGWPAPARPPRSPSSARTMNS